MSKNDSFNANKASRWQVFFRNIQQDLKLYVFILLVLCIFRIAFIAVLSQYINEATTMKEILSALYYGLRISLKSTGVITLLSFLFCTLVSVIFVDKNLEKVRFVLGCTYINALSLLFNARIPFYQDFHVAFNQFIFNTFKDDVVALGYTLVQQYHLPARLLASLLIALLFCRLLKLALATPTWQLPQFSYRYKTYTFRTGIILAIALLMLFSRFGGAFTYARSIHWENATVSRDPFLNEAILDDVQALYRAYAAHERLKEGQGLSVGTENIHAYAAYLAGRDLQSDHIDDFLRKQAQGPKIAKPKHIFIIIGESYANWPLMPKYKDVNIANGLKSLIAQGHAAYVPAFLPNGTGTMEAMNGMITGLAEVNLSPNYQPEAYKEVYSTAIAPQMKKLGYKTYLWYGGFSSWQRLKEFSLAQGFDQSYASNDMENQSGNAWGSEDKYFLNGILASFKDDEPSFHIILTTSNHPPYTVDVAKEGFDPASTFGGIPDKLKTDSEVIAKLGHFWYADRSITEFVETMYKRHPDSIFIITGDHADRFNIEPNPDLSERYTIPLVIYGQGIDAHLLPPSAAGGQLSIMPTLIELIAPRGFEYYSVVESMTKGNGIGLNRDFWITADHVGRNDFSTLESTPWAQNSPLQMGQDKIKQDIDAVQAVSWWMIKHGNSMK